MSWYKIICVQAILILIILTKIIFNQVIFLAWSLLKSKWIWIKCFILFYSFVVWWIWLTFYRIAALIQHLIYWVWITTFILYFFIFLKFLLWHILLITWNTSLNLFLLKLSFFLIVRLLNWLIPVLVQIHRITFISAIYDINIIVWYILWL